jgi:hypothetical protein
MLSKLRARLSYANVMATIAVFGVLGGVSYAAVNLPKNSVDAKAIEKNAVRAAEIAKKAVRSGEVKNGTLLCADFKSGESACQSLANTTVRAASETNLTGSNSLIIARRSCNPGEVVTGGGGATETPASPDARSLPLPAEQGTPTGWQWGQTVENGGSVVAFVVCAS